jgi:Recombination endonuclease VII
LGTGWEEGHIDHDHETGKFRGVICRRCNQVLGMVKDSQKILRGLKNFLKKATK